MQERLVLPDGEWSVLDDANLRIGDPHRGLGRRITPEEGDAPRSKEDPDAHTRRRKRHSGCPLKRVVQAQGLRYIVFVC